LITKYGESPLVAPGAELPQQLDGFTIAIALRAMKDLDEETAVYPFSGRGSLLGHWNNDINSHLPWQNGSAIFDVHENNNPFAGAIRERVNAGASILTSTEEDATDNVIVMRYDTTNKSNEGVGISMSVNGVNKRSDLANDPVIPFNLDVDARAVIGSKSWTQRAIVGEIVYVNKAVTQKDRQYLEGYLAHKWKFSDRLPGNHPHHVGPPTVPN